MAPISDSGASVLTGRRLGAFEVQERIGVGGMGEVYRAHDTKLGRDVAIKILPSHFTSDPDRLARFEREARVLASLNHPHIGAIYGLEDADGVRALVLELVEGETLADRIARGPMPVQRRADHRATDRGRARRGAREGHRPPRSEAGQHQDHARWCREGPRLRSGQGGLWRRRDRGSDAVADGDESTAHATVSSSAPPRT